jgi:hypothetical protein
MKTLNILTLAAAIVVLACLELKHHGQIAAGSALLAAVLGMAIGRDWPWPKRTQSESSDRGPVAPPSEGADCANITRKEG